MAGRKVAKRKWDEGGWRRKRGHEGSDCLPPMQEKLFVLTSLQLRSPVDSEEEKEEKAGGGGGFERSGMFFGPTSFSPFQTRW